MKDLRCFLTRALFELVFVAPAFDAQPKNNPYRQQQEESARIKSSSLPRSNCYSCMSMEFYEYWSEMERTYLRPSNFTDACLIMPPKANIGFIPCDGACIIIREQRLVGGSSQGYNVVRGCMATVTRTPFAADVTVLSRRSLSSRNVCHSIEAKNLYPDQQGNSIPNPPTRDSNSPTNAPRFLVTVCTCYGHLCNGEAVAASDKRFEIYLTPLLISSLAASFLYNRSFFELS